jgi:hypothetical protein
MSPDTRLAKSSEKEVHEEEVEVEVEEEEEGGRGSASRLTHVDQTYSTRTHTTQP